MPEPSFVHLHVHSHYSLLDGACRIPDLVKRVKALGMDALAITDHGAMFGVIEFYNECHKEGIKPIVGIEAYMAPGARTDRTLAGGQPGEAAYHLLLLAKDAEGYRNLLKLASTAYRDGFYYKPRIDKEILRELRGGLIATSACLGGEVPSALMKRDAKTARRIAETYLEIFGPDQFFIEIQKQGITQQDEVNPELVEVAKKVGCGIVATNDVHFLNKEDHYAHDVLCCISMGRLITDESRLKYPSELYLKSPAEMRQAVGQWPEAMENTVAIAKQCELQLDFSKRYAPVYRVPQEALKANGHADKKEDERYLRQLCEEGLVWRYGTADVAPEIRQRLEKELDVIAGKNFCSYFLIVWDFCNYARSEGIPVGARGSGVGTMVGYLLGLCNVDPLRYGLLFERFMDPSRSEMPDIDIDICQDGRQKVIDYVRHKYGHVAQIITFGTLAAKAACKDVGRVLGVPLAETEKLTKLIPAAPNMTLDKALRQSPDLQTLYKENPTVQKVIDIAKRLEGLCRNAGCHAAGVIIADQPLDELVPLYKDNENNILTQFEGPIAEKVGLLKMDFLGLRTLSTLQRSIDLVKKTKGLSIDIEKVDFTDQKVFELFRKGQTKGIFQFESGGMQDLLMKMRPDRIEDLIAANALYRPGPMELIPLYCNRKHGREAVTKIHPIMDAILQETYSIMVYQEQVMQIFNQLGGIELANAYKLIKAISKKNVEIIAKFQPAFIKGAMEKGVSQEKAEEIFDLILKFGGYGFNKSHSTRYAIVAFQTAYMKAYHPIEYMAALLTYEMGSTDKVVEYIEECRRMETEWGRGIRVLPPDVNVSDKDFTPVYVAVQADDSPRGKKSKREGTKARRHEEKKEGVIRFGLCAVRGVGEKAVEAIIGERKQHGDYRSLYDFAERVDLRQVTRATVEALIKCGAYSSVGAKRSQLLAILDRAVELGQQSQQDKRSGQLNMFAAAAAGPATTAPPEPLPQLDELESAELLKFEKEFLGFYITSHPLTEHQNTIDRYTTAGTREAMSLSEGTEVTIGGMINRVKTSITKSGRSAGQKMAWITLEDLDGNIDGVLWAEQYTQIAEKYPDAVETDRVVFVKGRIDRKRETPSLIVQEVIPVEQAMTRLTTALVVKLDRDRHTPADLAQLRPTLAKHKGSVPLFAQVNTDDGLATLRCDGECSVKISQELIDDLELLLGSGCAQLIGAGSKRMKRIAQQQLFKEAEAEASTQPMPATTEEDVMAAMDAEED